MNTPLPLLPAATLVVLAALGCRTASSDPPYRQQAERSEISNLKSEISEPETRDTGSSALETININTASMEELQRLPHVGQSMAERIIEHREKYGPFERPEHLMLLQGMSDVRFRRIRHLIRVE